MEGQEMDEFLRLMLEGVDVEALAAGDSRELDKFKVNMLKVGRMIYSKPPAERARWFSALRAGSLQLIAQIPVITPMLTAILESATGEDLGSKIDALGRDLGGKIDAVGRELGSKMDQMLSLQRETINLLARILNVLEERLPRA